MFDKLNDDCWLNILKYVDLKDQLALSQVSVRLHTNVQSHWRRLYEADLETEVVAHFKQQPYIMHEFLQSASRSLQSLVLERDGGSLLRLESWNSYSFPKMHRLHLWYINEVEDADKEMLLLTQLFPQLTKLTLQGSISGQYLWCWRQLEELHLICCESLDTSMFERIFSSLPLRKLTLLFYGYILLDGCILSVSNCATLEELVIDDHHLLGAFLPNLLQLPRFRRLAFYTRDHYEGLLQTVANMQPLRVKALLFNDTYWSSSRMSHLIVRMKNLRRMALQEDDIETQQLYNICASLPHLEELHLMKMRALPTPTQLWDMVDACQSLKLLNLSSCVLDAQFLELSGSCLNRVLRKRSASSPFTLHVHNTVLERNPQTTVDALEHPKLKISFKAVDINNWSSRFVEIEFDPPTS